MIKDFKYFREHYNDYEAKVNELIECVTDYVEDDIKNDEYSTIDWEKLCNHMSVDTVLDCILTDDWEDYDDANELSDIHNYLLTLFAKSVEQRLKDKGYDVDTIMKEIKDNWYN